MDTAKLREIAAYLVDESNGAWTAEIKAAANTIERLQKELEREQQKVSVLRKGLGFPVAQAEAS